VITTLLVLALLAVAAYGPPRCRSHRDVLPGALLWVAVWSSLVVLAVLSAR
jgi:hypothetical protein